MKQQAATPESVESGTGEAVSGRAPASPSLRPPRERRLGRVRLRTLLAIRWIAIAGQAGTLLFVHFVLGFKFPLFWALAAVGVLAAATLIAQMRRKARTRLTDRESALHFAIDIMQLSMLLFLTGGLTNPFTLLILAPVTVAAAVLSLKSTQGLVALVVICIYILGISYMPLPWYPGANFKPHPTFLIGLTIALISSVVFIALYVFRVAEESRRVANALMEAQSALEREQRLSSVGALAAAAAHELGSPLGTVWLVAKELQRDLPPDSPQRDDIDLLVSQSDRCRRILAEIAARPDRSSRDHFHLLAAPLLVELAAEPFRRPEVALRIETRPDPADPEPPLLPRRPEILRSLGNLLQNAIEFAKEEVRVAIAWNPDEIDITIADDGPGFSSDLLRKLGDPYVSAGLGGGERAEREGDHMGLGIFIAQTLIERSGGSVTFGNGALGSAEIRIIWPREALEHE